jgi:hypothetical protein
VIRLQLAVCRESKGNGVGHQFADSFKRDAAASTAVNL